MIQLCVCRYIYIEHLGSLLRLEQLLHLLRALQTSWVLNISIYARWRMN